MPDVIDLRSDTVTQPTPAMRAAMAAAEVGDDVFGEDPTVNALEAEVADRLGHEAGLFTPSGSMANQLGLRLHVKPGEELVCDSLAHVVRAELGAAAVFSGISSRTWVAPRTFAMRLLIGFSILATALALVGIYGVLSLSVGSRQKEIAVRKAVGAQGRDILRLILGEGSRMIATGIVLGAVVSIFVGRALEDVQRAVVFPGRRVQRGQANRQGAATRQEARAP